MRLEVTRVHGSDASDSGRVSDFYDDLTQGPNLGCFVVLWVLHASYESSSGDYASIPLCDAPLIHWPKCFDIPHHLDSQFTGFSRRCIGPEDCI